MASAKELRKKIRSISNTRKITRTMEMVAASKSKKTTRRVEMSTPYAEKLRDLLASLRSGRNVRHPLLPGYRADEDERTPPPRGAVLVVTANRGLCGGYNTSVLQLAERWLRAERERGRENEIDMVGKKGISRFRFRRIPLHAAHTHIDDWPGFHDAEALADGYMDRFLGGEIDRVSVISTRYHSAGSQKPEVVRLLPIEVPEANGESEEEGEDAGPSTDFIFEPDPETILESLLPFFVRHRLFRLLIEAAASEQIARRVAMKSATDNAQELIKAYTRMYNRQRQAGITQQIMEIVGGAQALE